MKTIRRFQSTITFLSVLLLLLLLPSADGATDNEQTSGEDGRRRRRTRRRRIKTGSHGDSNIHTAADSGDGGEGNGGLYFNRVSTWFVCSQLDASCNVDNVTSAEQLAASSDGMKILYVNALSGVVGAVDISDIYNPVAAGSIDLKPLGGGEPTSIAACSTSNMAIVAVDTSMEDKLNPSGVFHVIDMETLKVVYTGDLGGQPDCIKISKDCSRAVLAIENERNEDLYFNYTVTVLNNTTGLHTEQVLQNNTPGLPQYPGGFMIIMDITAPDPANWTLTNVNISGLGNDIVEDGDPEPEFVSINDKNIVIVTLQENNGLVLINATDYTVLDAYSAGTVSLVGMDTLDDGTIQMVVDPTTTTTTNTNSTTTQTTKPREPDGVVWIDADHFVTADEGDWNGGTRGFTIWTDAGEVVYTSGIEMDQEAMRVGHYPDHRSAAKGNEPENVEFGVFLDGGDGEKDELLFVNSERSSLIFVYDVKNKSQPVLRQVLPAGAAPEGGLAIPSRNLFVVASEEDERGLDIRGSISIYKKGFGQPIYPFILSRDHEPNIPIPFGALSSLATGKCRRQEECDESKYFYSVDDATYKKNRIFKINPTRKPAVIVQEIFISDMDSVLRRTLENDFDFGVDAVNAVINPSDQTVNLDVEGVDTSVIGGFWVIHEGPANTTDAEILEPQAPEMLLYVSRTGVIKEAIPMPTNANNTRVQGSGLEGVAEDYMANVVVVSFHRALPHEEHPRLAIWDRGSQEWSFALYPVDDPESQYASEESMVVVSDLAFTGTSGQFLVMEHDNRAGPDAAVKRIYQVDLTKLESPMEVVEKTLVFDILPDLKVATNGPAVEKIGGLTIDRNGDVWIINDNGGMKDNNGETILIKVGSLSPHAEGAKSKKHTVDNRSGDDIFVADKASPSKRKKSNKKRQR